MSMIEYTTDTPITAKQIRLAIWLRASLNVSVAVSTIVASLIAAFAYFQVAEINRLELEREYTDEQHKIRTELIELVQNLERDSAQYGISFGQLSHAENLFNRLEEQPPAFYGMLAGLFRVASLPNQSMHYAQFARDNATSKEQEIWYEEMLAYAKYKTGEREVGRSMLDAVIPRIKVIFGVETKLNVLDRWLTAEVQNGYRQEAKRMSRMMLDEARGYYSDEVFREYEDRIMHVLKARVINDESVDSIDQST